MSPQAEPLHIAFVITRGDAVGGATVHVRDMARYLLDRGDRATVLVGEAHGGNQEALDELRRYEIPCCKIPSLRRAIDPAHDIVAVTELVRALRKIKPDLVSTHTAKPGCSAASPRAPPESRSSLRRTDGPSRTAFRPPAAAYFVSPNVWPLP